MTTAAYGLNATRDLSLSSTSATANSPFPKRTAPSHPGTFAPFTHIGSRPQRARTCPSIAVTVDFPHVPTTATSLYGESVRASALARCVTGMPSSFAFARPGLVSSIAVETMTSSVDASIPLPSSGKHLTPIDSRKRMFPVPSVRSAPVTSSPSLTSAVARALIPTPPMPIR